MVRKLGAIGATVFITNSTKEKVSLKLTVLTGVFVGALLLQARPACSRQLWSAGVRSFTRALMTCESYLRLARRAHPHLQVVFRPHTNRELFKLETLGLLGCSLMVYGARAATPLCRADLSLQIC